MNDIIDCIHARRSIGNLSLPMPSTDELHCALTAAMTAPDHKLLRPYRFVVMTDQALHEFGQVLCQAGSDQAVQQGGTLDEMACQKLQNLPKRAPMIVAVMTDYKNHPKVPQFEQLLCVGAVIQNLLLVLQSMGYRTIWRTGDLCNHLVVKQHFGLTGDNLICGFVYIGSSDIDLPKRDTMTVMDFLSVY